MHFRRLEQQYRLKTLPSLRTRIVEGRRYRIPDVLLGAIPLPRNRIMIAVPLVIEVLSPDDKVAATLERYRDYSSIGVAHIVQLDPERCIAHRFESGSLIETRFTELRLPHIEQAVPFDPAALFERLRDEIQATSQPI